VTDTGTGIPENILDNVFEPFFTTKSQGEGSGLGLAMVHGFVKQSGGHVRIYSEEGHGTTVKIYLPRMTQAEETRAVPAGKPSDVAPMPRAKPSEVILLVEDNEGVRAYAKDVLEDLGYWVLEAASAENAIRIVAKKPRTISYSPMWCCPGLPAGNCPTRSSGVIRICRCCLPPAIRAMPSSTRAGSIPTFTCSASPTPSRNSPANCASCSTLDLKRACPLECAPLPMAVRG
jgi:CheY-like chemotaxis protein